ncbi:MAG TPA: MFS transporter [Candidatus Limnocylindria bacterium]|jgi:MFS family permease
MSGFLRGLRENLGALEERNFRLLWLGQTGSTFGDGLSFVAIAFAVLQIGGTATDIGLVFAAYSLPNVVFLLAGGVWADRLPRNLVMIGSDTIRATVQAGLAVLLLTDALQVWHVIIAAGLHGAASAFFVPASVGLMPQVLSPGRLQQGNALMAISRSAAFVVGPALSGILVAAFGPAIVFAIDGVTYLFSILTLAMLRIGRAVADAVRQSFVSELVLGWREVRTRDWLVASLAAFAVSNVSLGAFMVLGPVIIDRELGGAAEWGLIQTIGAIGALVGGAVALRWRPARPLMVGFLVMLVAATRSLALIPPLPVALIAICAMATLAATTISNTLWETVLQQRIPQGSLSRVSSYDWMVSLVFQPISFAIIGPLAATIGEVSTLLLSAAIGLVAQLGALAVPSIRNMRRLELDPNAGPPVDPPLQPPSEAAPIASA